MDEYKCGDCFHATLCEKSKMLVGFSRDNPAYCGMFLNSADVVPVKHGRWVPALHVGDCCYRCSECQFLRDAYLLDIGNYCPKCGTKMDGE